MAASREDGRVLAKMLGVELLMLIRAFGFCPCNLDANTAGESEMDMFTWHSSEIRRSCRRTGSCGDVEQA